jgi:uncharacterized protein YbaA (DUF1428 family)
MVVVPVDIKEIYRALAISTAPLYTPLSVLHYMTVSSTIV